MPGAAAPMGRPSFVLYRPTTMPIPTSREAKAQLEEADVLHVAKLARLRLSPEEVSRMTAELRAIVSYAGKLAELDTSDVPPTTQVQVERLPLRPDEPHQSLSHEDALREAPRVGHEGFAVPGFVED